MLLSVGGRWKGGMSSETMATGPASTELTACVTFGTSRFLGGLSKFKQRSSAGRDVACTSGLVFLEPIVSGQPELLRLECFEWTCLCCRSTLDCGLGRSAASINLCDCDFKYLMHLAWMTCKDHLP